MKEEKKKEEKETKQSGNRQKNSAASKGCYLWRYSITSPTVADVINSWRRYLLLIGIVIIKIKLEEKEKRWCYQLFLESV